MKGIMFEKNYTVVMDMNQLQSKNMTIEALSCQIKKRL